MSEFKKVVAFSGGQDSTTILCKAVAFEGARNILAITANYGQKHSTELIAAQRICTELDVSHEIVSMEGLLLSTSPLTNPREQLETYSNPEEMEEIIGDRREKTFVPMRNPLFLTVAANRAIHYGATEVWTGICQADNANYSDCTEVFRQHLETMINTANGYYQHKDIPRINVVAPLMNFSKAQTVRMMIDTPGAYHIMSYSHTAYSGEYPPITQDHATVLRAQGFRDAHVPDPLLMRAAYEGDLALLPEGENYARFEYVLHQDHDSWWHCAKKLEAEIQTYLESVDA